MFQIREVHLNVINPKFMCFKGCSPLYISFPKTKNNYNYKSRFGKGFTFIWTIERNICLYIVCEYLRFYNSF